MGLWDEIIIFFTGKKIAILGEREVGKTVLFKYLTGEGFKTEYNATLVCKTKSNSICLNESKLNIKKSKDVGGSEDTYKIWENIFKESDIILYLFRADKIIDCNDSNTQQKLLNEIQKFKAWKNQNKKIILRIGTYLDKCPISYQNSDKYYDYIKDHQWNAEFEKIGITNLIIGSMKDEKGMREVIEKILKLCEEFKNGL